MLFTTREQATCILLAAGVLLLAIVPSLRRSLGNVILVLVTPKVAVPLGLYTAVLTAAVLLARRVDLWAPDLTGATVLWYLLTGFTLFMSATDAGNSQSFFRRRVHEAISLAAFFEFLDNLHTFNVPVEIVLQLAFIFVGVLRVFCSSNDEYAQIEGLLTSLISVAGLVLLAITTYHLAHSWDDLDRVALGRLLVLPVWLTLVSLVAVYIFALYAEYQLAFLCVYFATAARRLRCVLRSRW